MSETAPATGPIEEPPLMLLDACAVINLYACGHMSDILASNLASFGIVTHVRREALFVRRGGTGDDACERVLIDLEDVLSRRLLDVVPEASEDELNTFIDLSVELGDGEAMTAAIALHRGCSVVTDDRVALRVIDGRVPTMASLEVIRRWAEEKQIARAAITTALVNLRERGSYLPGRTHPLRLWWEEFFAPSP